MIVQPTAGPVLDRTSLQLEGEGQRSQESSSNQLSRDHWDYLNREHFTRLSTEFNTGTNQPVVDLLLACKWSPDKSGTEFYSVVIMKAVTSPEDTTYNRSLTLITLVVRRGSEEYE